MDSVIEFKLPALGENIEQGDLVRLMVAPGAKVSEGQAVIELETDKAVVEVPSSVSGTVKEILVKEGDKIKVGQVVFTADSNGNTAVTKSAPEEQPVRKSAPKARPAAEPVAPAAKSQPAQQSAQAASLAAQASAGASEFRLQELGENISQGELVRLMVGPGAKVSEGQPVMELETDKAVVEVPSSVSGIVNEIKVKEGEKIKVGQLIFTLQVRQRHKRKHLARKSVRWNTSRDSTGRAWRFKRRFAPREKPKSKLFLPISPWRGRRRFPCRCS